ncbi:MAG: hypothetical protein WCS15_11220 [Prevotella sp.]
MSSINYKKGVEEAIWLYKVAYLSVKEYDDNGLYELAASTRRELDTLKRILKAAGYTDTELERILEPERKTAKEIQK